MKKYIVKVNRHNGNVGIIVLYYACHRPPETFMFELRKLYRERKPLSKGDDIMAEHVCPWWIGYLMASPVRKLFEKPQRLIGSYVEPGMRVLDVGCAMGFFSLALAGMVGSEGTVVAVDLQERMIRSLAKRARRRGYQDIIESRVCRADSLLIDDLDGRMDLALAIHVVHEVPDPPRLMREVHRSLRPGAKFYVSEPRGRVTGKDFAVILEAAAEAGFDVTEQIEKKRELTALMVRKK